MNTLVRTLLLIAVGAGLGWSVNGWRMGEKVAKVEAARSSDRAAYDRERESASLRLVRIVDAFRATETTMADAAATIQKASHEKVTAARADAADLRRRLRTAEADARAHAGGDAGPAEPATDQAFAAGSLGALIPGPAAELVEEAERADVIRIELTACYRQYDEVRDALRKLGGVLD